jgi:hypothetical protein
MDYAERLAKAGNNVAADAVRNLVPKGEGAEMISKAYESIPILKASDDIRQLTDIFSRGIGGGGR